MKTPGIFLAFIVIQTSSVMAQSQVDLPPDAARLKKVYQEEVQKETQRLRSRYLADLQRLQEAYTKNGKLEQALAIREEVSRTKGGSSGAIETGVLTGDLLCSKKWAFTSGNWRELWTFRKDGRMSGDREHAGTWKILGDTLRMDFDNNQWSEFSTLLLKGAPATYLKETLSDSGKRADVMLLMSED